MLSTILVHRFQIEVEIQCGRMRKGGKKPIKFSVFFFIIHRHTECWLLLIMIKMFATFGIAHFQHVHNSFLNTYIIFLWILRLKWAQLQIIGTLWVNPLKYLNIHRKKREEYEQKSPSSWRIKIKMWNSALVKHGKRKNTLVDYLWI